jgi:asparagine synthase (glutamine-hydrolysing)
MCGICGIINLQNKPVNETSIREMMGVIKHRGPNDEGVLIEENTGLGFVRLSILDLSPAGHQPMFSEDNRYVIVFNGELFNYIELQEELRILGYIFRTKTDTEVLLNAYVEWGEDCLHKLNGMWSFAIYDRELKTMFTSRDRYGIKPFYYYCDKEIFIFSSEIPPILSVLHNKPQPNFQSIFDYLVFNRTDQTEETFFEGIRKLQHGHNIKIDIKKPDRRDALSITKWYDLRSEVRKTEGFKSPEEFRQLFSDAVGLRLRSDVPVGVCLSGGLDSSSIVSVLLNDYDKLDLKTFSAVYEKGQYGDETEFIKEYTNKLKNMFFITPNANTLHSDIQKFVRAHGEPIPSTSPYAQFKVMELARGKVVVTLDGQGADEMLAGYHYFFGYFFKDLLKHGRLWKLSSEIFHYIKLQKSIYGLKTFSYFMLSKSLRSRIRVKEKGYLKGDFVKLYSNSNSIAGTLYGSDSLQDALLDHFEYKLEHLLKWEDRNSMWFSLEARVPFLDHRLVERTLAINDNSMINKGMTKSILREAMKGTIPEKIRLRRDKIGFDTPQDEWLRDPAFNELVEEILSPGSFITTNFINREKAIKLFESNRKGNANISKEIWKWIHLEIWYRMFIGV